MYEYMCKIIRYCDDSMEYIKNNGVFVDTLLGNRNTFCSRVNAFKWLQTINLLSSIFLLCNHIESRQTEQCKYEYLIEIYYIYAFIGRFCLMDFFLVNQNAVMHHLIIDINRICACGYK